jgi:hypothetical protein
MAPLTAAPAPAEPRVMTESTELAIITSAQEFTGAIARLEKTCHLLTPFTSFGALAPQHALFPTIVKISTDKDAGDVYDGVGKDGRQALQFLKPGEVALAKNGLQKIADALGINIHLDYLHDGGAIRHFYHVRAVAAYRGLDGQWIQRQASEVWDLRDSSERMRGWTANQIAEGRKHGLRQCETRAINAVIRACGGGVKQAYKKTDLDKPFVAMRVAFVPDAGNADQMRVVQEHAMQGASILFAGRSSSFPSSVPPPEAFADPADPPIDAVPVGSGTTPAAQHQTSAPAPSVPAPKPDLPPVEGAVRIAKVEVKTGETKGRKWTRFLIVDSNGVTFSTFERQHYTDAEKFLASKDWVEIVTETNGPYTNIIEIIKAGSEPKLPGVDEV